MEQTTNGEEWLSTAGVVQYLLKEYGFRTGDRAVRQWIKTGLYGVVLPCRKMLGRLEIQIKMVDSFVAMVNDRKPGGNSSPSQKISRRSGGDSQKELRERLGRRGGAKQQ